MTMPARETRLRFLAGVAGLGAIVLWAYWPTLWAMAEKWYNDPQYSHGFLVPVFAAYLLWRRRGQLEAGASTPSAWGVVLLGAGVALHLAGAYLFFDWLDMASLLVLLAGLSLCAGGRPALRWAWPSIAFLVFMLPLPHRLEVALSQPLQRFATLGSTYALQTLGFGAVSEGNVILMDHARIGVVGACNGLGMLVTFFALTVAVAIVLRRPLVDRLVIVLSAIPIALAANLVRITVTGVLHAEVGGEIADLVFHDLAGWLMMPLALGLLWAEVRLLSRLLVEPEPEDLAVMAFAAPARPEAGTNHPRPAASREAAAGHVPLPTA
jgi:exosortase